MGRSERQDSLLTKEMRRTLLGTSTIERSGSLKRNFETAMRKRIASGLSDFQTLNKALDRQDVDENGTITNKDLRVMLDSRLAGSSGHTENSKFDSDDPDIPSPEFSDTANASIAFTHMVTFAYRSLRALGNETHEALNEAILRGALIGEAKHRGVAREYVALVWDETAERVDIKVHEQSDLDPLEKWDEGLPLSAEDKHELDRRLLDRAGEEEFMEHAWARSHHSSDDETISSNYDHLVEKYLLGDE